MQPGAAGSAHLRPQQCERAENPQALILMQSERTWRPHSQCKPSSRLGWVRSDLPAPVVTVYVTRLYHHENLEGGRREMAGNPGAQEGRDSEGPGPFSLAQPPTRRHAQGTRDSQSLLVRLGSLGWPQLGRPVRKRAAVCRQHAAVRVMHGKPTDSGLESFGKQPLSGLWPLFLPQPLFSPVTDVDSPLQNCGLGENRHSPEVTLKADRFTGSVRPQLRGGGQPPGLGTQQQERSLHLGKLARSAPPAPRAPT